MEGGPGRDRNGEKESRLEIGPKPQKAVVPWSRTSNKGGGEKCSSLEYVLDNELPGFADGLDAGCEGARDDL